MTISKRGYSIKTFLQNVVAGGACLIMLVWLLGNNAVALSAHEGRREFYIGSASSQGVRKSVLTWQDFCSVKGESVTFLLNEGENVYEAAAGIATAYRAEILFVEKVGDVYSFYAYTPLWWERIVLNGTAVNLHIAIDIQSGRCAVGAPIIFGGF